MSDQTKNQKAYTDRGFGFPVQLLNVPMIKVRGKWTPHIDYNRLAKAVLIALSEKPVRLSGHEVRFIRLHFEMTLQDFAARFAVSHPAVIKWERTDDEATGMNWATEKDLRLFILSRLSTSSKELALLYQKLETSKEIGNQAIQLDINEIAA